MTAGIASELAMIDARTVGGYVYRIDDPKAVLVVEIIADGEPVAAVRADHFSPALADANIAEPNRGFVFTLPDRLAARVRRIEARLANLAVPVGQPLDREATLAFAPRLAAAGSIEAVEGSRITGWVRASAATAVRAILAGEDIATTIANVWETRELGGAPTAVAKFVLTLPAGIAVGARIDIVTTSGQALAGSPVTIGGE